MKILLHVCCGPCTIYPLRFLREKGHTVEAFFYNPNIHPYMEFRRRIDALQELAALEKLPLVIDPNYGLQEYLRRVVFHERERCELCYDMRLGMSAAKAEQEGFDAFTTTLLYSKYQNHRKIKEKGELLAVKNAIPFYYADFRTGWQEGIDRSKEMGLYRQPYCGCIYSEQERYDKTLRNTNKQRQE